jgi:hypothetical protein
MKYLLFTIIAFLALVALIPSVVMGSKALKKVLYPQPEDNEDLKGDECEKDSGG